MNNVNLLKMAAHQPRPKKKNKKENIINASINSYIFLLAILTHHVFNSPRSISHIHHRVIEYTQSVDVYTS